MAKRQQGDHPEKVVAYGFEKLGFTIPNEDVIGENFQIQWRSYTAPSSLEGADGVIIPQGIFEHFEWETGLRPSARCSIPRQPGLRLFGMSSEPSSSATELRRLPFTFLSAAILEC